MEGEQPRCHAKCRYLLMAFNISSMKDKTLPQKQNSLNTVMKIDHAEVRALNKLMGYKFCSGDVL